MKISFDGKRALVTGAGSGIGRAVAIRLVKCGAEVVAVDLSSVALEELSISCKGIKTLCLDISNWEDTEKAISEAGPIDLLVNCAGVNNHDLPKKSKFIDEKSFDRLFNINVKAVINITQSVAKGMISRGQGGSIVNISSISSHVQIPDESTPAGTEYGASKAAVDHLTKRYAVEYGPYNIRVNAVNPTYTRTNLMKDAFDDASVDSFINKVKAKTPLKRLGEVDDIAYPIVFLLSDLASLINGVNLLIDGGIMCT